MYLRFCHSGDEVALQIVAVRDVAEKTPLDVPDAKPHSIRGYIQWQGQTVPIVDLAHRLGMAESPITPATCYVIAEVENGHEQSLLGVLADSKFHVRGWRPPALPNDDPAPNQELLSYLQEKIIIIS